MDLRDKNGLTLEEAIARYRSKNYPKPALTADIAVFRREAERLFLLLIKRGGHPYLGCWALPGGFADENEAVEQTAARELEEETGVKGLKLQLTGFYSAPGRDPRGWVVSAAFAALIEEGIPARAGDDAAAAAWFELTCENGAARVKGLDAGAIAFDHLVIIRDAYNRLLNPLTA